MLRERFVHEDRVGVEDRGDRTIFTEEVGEEALRFLRHVVPQVGELGKDAGALLV